MVSINLCKAIRQSFGFKIGAHSLRATAATNALDHQADIAKVQEWLGHANIATTRIYDHRQTRPEDSPTSRWPIDMVSRSAAVVSVRLTSSALSPLTAAERDGADRVANAIDLQ